MSSLARHNTRKICTFAAFAAVILAVAAIPASAGDDNISGAVVPTGGSAIRGSLDGVSNADDVYKVALNGGDTVTVRLSGSPGSDFDLYIYPPGAKDIWRNSEVAWSENPGTSKESISYDVPSSGTYYIDVASWDTAGSYKLTITSPTRITIDSSTSQVAYGGTAKISGTLSPADIGATVKLLERPASSGDYATAASSNVGTGGKFEFTVSPKENTSYQAVFSGDVDHKSASSGTVSVSVKPTLSIMSSASQITLGSSVTLSGRMSPGHGGETVIIQRLLSRGWSRLKTIRLDSSSRFTWAYKPPSADTYDLRTTFDGDDSHDGNSSGRIRITVVTPPRS